MYGINCKLCDHIIDNSHDVCYNYQVLFDINGQGSVRKTKNLLHAEYVYTEYYLVKFHVNSGYLTVKEIEYDGKVIYAHFIDEFTPSIAQHWFKKLNKLNVFK